MNKLILLGIAATLGAARLAFFPANPPVELQPASPGTAQTGNLNVTGTATVGLLKSQGTVFGASTAPTGFAYGGFFTAASNQGRGFYGFASSTSGLTYGGFFQNASDSGRAVYGLATATTGFNYGGYFQSASDQGRGILGVAASPTGTSYGVYGKAVSPTGFGVYADGNMAASGVISGNGSGLTQVDAALLGGKASNQFFQVGNMVHVNIASSPAIWGETSLNGGSGIYGVNLVGQGKGVSGRSDTGGFGTYGFAGGALPGIGVGGETTSPSGEGVFGRAHSNTGATRGVHAKVQSPDGIAILGENNATTGAAIALSAYTLSSSGLGGQFWAYSTSGTTMGLLATNQSTAGHAFFAQALGASGTTYGVYSRVDSPSGWGVSTNGKLSAGGTKSFRIDHPFDPEHKYLLHYCTESPSPQNFYSGNIVTDERGYAWVILPEYFEEINKNFKYQLTVISGGEDFLQAMVSKKIQGNRFQVRTSAPRVEVSWRVEADRNDLYVRNRPTSDVEEKVGREIGTYQYPEFYGKPAERGVFYEVAHPRRAGDAKGMSGGQPARSQK